MLDQIKSSYPKEYNYFHLMVVAGLLLFSGYIGLSDKTYLQKFDYVFVGMGLALFKMITLRDNDSIILDFIVINFNYPLVRLNSVRYPRLSLLSCYF